MGKEKKANMDNLEFGCERVDGERFKVRFSVVCVCVCVCVCARTRVLTGLKYGKDMKIFKS